MIAEQIESFRNGLIEKTKAGRLKWKPLVLYSGWEEIESELIRRNIPADYNANSIRVETSYYLESGEGVVLLLEIVHGYPEVTSPEYDTLALLVKVNTLLPIDNLTYFNDEEQEQLRALHLLIEADYDERYPYPETLYEFMNQVTEG